MKALKISVITPSLNSSATIRSTIDSILIQDFKSWEHIVIDAQSTDGTLEILKSYAHIKWISELDNGIYDAMNKGISMASGEWIYFLGSDDFLFDSHVFSDISEHLDERVGIIYGRYHNLSNGKNLGSELTLPLFLEQNLCHQTIFFRSSIFQMLGRFSEKYKILADAEFNMRWYSSATIESKFMNRLFVNYGGKGKSTIAFDYDYYRDYYALVKKYFRISSTNRLNAPLHRKLYYQFMQMGNTYLVLKHSVLFVLSRRNIESLKLLARALAYLVKNDHRKKK